ncbi:MAG: guanylate kinase [Lachnospiraceae bacterium]|nr:guanylate kinase [Lachnospiraceae bacterium]
MKMPGKGIIAVISGFSGAGKGTVVNELVNKYGYAVSISATTRPPREGEEEGKNYFFKTKEEFKQMVKEGRFMEYARYVDNYYGTPKDYVYSQINNGRDVLLEIEMQGAMQVKKNFPDVTLVFITPPHVAELKRRLLKRGTETEDIINKRIARAAEECSYMKDYDYIIVNDGLEECVEQVHCLLTALHFTKNNQQQLIEDISRDFKGYNG